MLPLVLAAAVSSMAFSRSQIRPCPAPAQIPTASTTHARLSKLGDLPDANQVLLVLRTVDGCAYQQVVRFKVSTSGGQPAADPRGVLVPDGPRLTPVAPAGR